MFSKGQIIFMIAFLVVFAIALIWSYRVDRKDTRKHYPGAWKVIVIVALVLVAMVYILRIIRRL
jgi:4-amino-4-deoxy-L-arabinose transferase-like glycosyltransferase